MFGFLQDFALAQLSHFAGRQLAFASHMLVQNGSLIPFGMKLTFSWWHGSTEAIEVLGTDDPNSHQH